MAGQGETIVVSACLLGVRCTHTGGSNPSQAVFDLAAEATLVPICPEVAGGLSTPRQACELTGDGRAVTEAGEDLTALFLRGAAVAVATARAAGARRAVLKARSPSCGCHGTRPGLAAAALMEAGVGVTDEEDEAAARSAQPPTMEPPSGA